jgi:5-methylcytosine-specific restriction endonuclease McrA
MAKKPKASSITKRLDKLLSIAVRLRDTDDYGNGHCCTCGRLLKYEDSDAGHFIGRGRFGTRWDLENVHMQCTVCNRGSGADIKYYKFMLGKYGQAVIDRLDAQSARHAPSLDYDLIRNELLAEILVHRCKKMFNVTL